MEGVELLEQHHLEMQELIRENQLKNEALLQSIVDALSGRGNNDDVIKAIKEIVIPAAGNNSDIVIAITENIDKFVKQVKEIRLLPPSVTVEPTTVNLNQERVVGSLEKSTDRMIKKLEELRPIPDTHIEKWEFTVKRDSSDLITSVTAIEII